MKDDLNRFGACGGFLSLTAGEIGENDWTCVKTISEVSPKIMDVGTVSEGKHKSEKK
jgi:hypothetical protein